MGQFETHVILNGFIISRFQSLRDSRNTCMGVYPSKVNIRVFTLNNTTLYFVLHKWKKIVSSYLTKNLVRAPYIVLMIFFPVGYTRNWRLYWHVDFGIRDDRMGQRDLSESWGPVCFTGVYLLVLGFMAPEDWYVNVLLLIASVCCLTTADRCRFRFLKTSTFFSATLTLVALESFVPGLKVCCGQLFLEQQCSKIVPLFHRIQFLHGLLWHHVSWDWGRLFWFRWFCWTVSLGVKQVTSKHWKRKHHESQIYTWDLQLFYHRYQCLSAVTVWVQS